MHGCDLISTLSSEDKCFFKITQIDDKSGDCWMVCCSSRDCILICFKGNIFEQHLYILYTCVQTCWVNLVHPDTSLINDFFYSTLKSICQNMYSVLCCYRNFVKFGVWNLWNNGDHCTSSLHLY